LIVKLGKMKISEEGLAVISDWRNFYIVGGTRSGKTNFMIFLADWQMPDHALVVIDPHGELAPQIATLAPKDRLIST
jgi:Flp pilus assembly CpaF family ATPase